MKLKQTALALASGISTLALSGYVHATSVLTSDMKDALGVGFTNMSDTAVDIAGTSFPYVLAIVAVGGAVAMVVGLARRVMK